MAVYGLLIDYEYCTGCSSCDVSCKEEHGYPVGKWGIRVFDDGPWEIEEGVFNWNKIPVPTDLCDLCAERTGKGREPVCVHHCLANVIRYDTVENLAVQLQKKPKQVLFVPQYKPLEAKGPFVPGKKGERKSKASQMKVEANEAFEIATRRDYRTFIED
ncbi:MAG TPA: oxidoreductase [Syntrophomonas sp.]|jgi:Fe-S-cluster-containing dehydrogenase component|nr:oxidoreductase [Syntrophomonas sp.]